MSQRWEGCTKIHQNCGGLVKWVEAIHTPGVGYYGQCEKCTQNCIVVEHIIPIETAQPELGVLIDRGKYEKIAELEWDNDATWDENQERLKEQIEAAL